MATKYVTKTLIHPGDKIETLLESLMNKSLTSANEVQVAVEVPAGVSYASSNLGQGIFDSGSGIWSVGTLTKAQTVSGNLVWNVEDDCLAPFKFVFKVQAVGGNVCIEQTNEDYCIIIQGITKCQLDTYKAIKTIVLDYTLGLQDYTILVDASTNAVDITLPEPSDAYRQFPQNPNMDGGKEWHIKTIDLTNPVTLTTPSGKIVDMSNISDATDTFTFSVVGQTAFLHSDGTNYFVKKV